MHVKLSCLLFLSGGLKSFIHESCGCSQLTAVLLLEKPPSFYYDLCLASCAPTYALGHM